jgi:hypothetical protein
MTLLVLGNHILLVPNAYKLVAFRDTADKVAFGLGDRPEVASGGRARRLNVKGY